MSDDEDYEYDDDEELADDDEGGEEWEEKEVQNDWFNQRDVPFDFRRKWGFVDEESGPRRNFLLRTVLDAVSPRLKGNYRAQVRDTRAAVITLAGRVQLWWPKDADALLTCRPAAPVAWLKCPEKNVQMKHTCQFRVCPQCYYRRARKAYTALEQLQAERWVAAWVDIPLVNTQAEELDTVREKLIKLNTQLRKRLYQVYGFKTGIRFLKLCAEPRRWRVVNKEYDDAHGNRQLMEVPAPYWSFRYGFCGPCETDRQAELVPVPKAESITQRRVGTNLVDVFADAAYYGTNFCTTALATDWQYIKKLTKDLSCFSEYGNTPVSENDDS